jgi:guanylate kinase
VRETNLFVVSGPSAVGKTSVVNEILKRDDSLSRIVTYTTRTKRESEKHGEDYFFIAKKDFLSAAERGDFVEFSEVYGNYYGIAFSTLKEKMKEGKDAVLVINWEGFLKIKKALPKNVYGIFILPPSIEELERRIRSRGEDSPETISRRMVLAANDIKKVEFYDFSFKNFDIETTAGDILATIDEIRQKSPIA